MEKKKWRLHTIVLFGINCVVGSGIFLLPGSAYSLLGPSSLLAYLFVLILVMSIALCFAECGSIFEKSGGPFLYAKEAFGDFFGYEVGIMKWIVGIIAWATVAVGFSTALSAMFPSLNGSIWLKLIPILLIIVLSISNIFGINIMAYINNLSTIAKLLPMLVFIIGGFFFLKGTNFVPFVPKGVHFPAVSVAVVTVFYAFTGFENVGIAAGDMDNPKKNVPRALIISMSLVSIIYFLIQFNCIGLLGTHLGGTQTPVASAISSFMGPQGSLLVTIGTLISIGGLNVTSSFNVPRSAQALAKDNLLPKSLGKDNKHHVPYLAVIVTAVLAIALTLTGNFAELAVISVISRFSQYIPTCIAVIVFRRKKLSTAKNYHAPFGLFFPILALLTSAFLLINTDPMKLIIGLGMMVVVAPLYPLMRKLNKVAPTTN